MASCQLWLTRGKIHRNVIFTGADADWIRRANVILPSIKQSSLPAHNTPQYIPVRKCLHCVDSRGG